MKINTTTDDDLRALMFWIKDKDSCRLWGGSQVRFPLSLESIKEDLCFSSENTFSLFSDKGVFLGLGQIFEKSNGCIHLARIIISPEQRGKGLGEQLCRLLIKEGWERFGEREVSLYVYSTNIKAVRLYKRLGFNPSPAPPDSIVYSESIYMVLKPNQAIQSTR